MQNFFSFLIVLSLWTWSVELTAVAIGTRGSAGTSRPSRLLRNSPSRLATSDLKKSRNSMMRPQVNRRNLESAAVSSFQGKLWFDRYDSVLDSHFREHSPLILLVHKLSRHREFRDSGLQKRLLVYLDQQVLPEALKKELINEILCGPVLKESSKETQKLEETRSDKTSIRPFEASRRTMRLGYSPSLGDWPLANRFTLDPRSFIRPRSIKNYIESKGTGKEELRYLAFVINRNRDLQKQMREYLSEPIHKKLLSEDNFPFFVSMMHDTSFGNFSVKVDYLKVVDRGEIVSVREFFHRQDKRKEALRLFYQDESASESQRASYLVTALGCQAYEGFPLTLKEILDLSLRNKSTHKIDFTPEIESVFLSFSDPIEKVMIASLFIKSAEKDLDFVFSGKSFSLEERQNYRWLCFLLSGLNHEDLNWVLYDLTQAEHIEPITLGLKTELLAGDKLIECLLEYAKRFEDSDDFMSFVLILSEFSARLNGDAKVDFAHHLLALEEDADLSLKSLQILTTLSRNIASNMHSERFESNVESLVAEFHQNPITIDLVDLYLDKVSQGIFTDDGFEGLDSCLSKVATIKLPANNNIEVSDLFACPEKTGWTEIQGIPIPMNLSGSGSALVPSLSSASLVETETSQRMLRILAGQWRTSQATLLEGPTGAGKTSYIKYIAAATGSPYRRINLSYNTDVRDLIGRWVAGEERFSYSELSEMSETRLLQVAKSMGFAKKKGMDHRDLCAEIFELQQNPHWEDGPVVQAMRQGEVLLLDEINLAKPQVIEALNSLFDSNKLVVDDHDGEIVMMHPDSRIFATMNPSSYIGRVRLSDAFKSRCAKVAVEGPSLADLVKIIGSLYPGLFSDANLERFISAHASLELLASEGQIGKDLGGLVFSLRNIFRVAHRVEMFKESSGLEFRELLRREIEEVYLGAILDAEELRLAQDALLLSFPGVKKDYYANLRFFIDQNGFSIGDVRVEKTLKKKSLSDLVPSLEASEIVMTSRTKRVFYKMVKAAELGEHVALVGERASGKTVLVEYYAALKGLPFYRQVFSAKTDNMETIGMYTPHGWQDGTLLKAGRSDGEPGIYLADEFNQANDAVQERLNSLLDGDRKLVLAERGGSEEMIFAGEFRFIAAFNPPSRKYGGRRKLSKAIQSRLSVQVVPELESESEYIEIFTQLTSDRGLPKAIVKSMVQLHFWVKDEVYAYRLGGSLSLDQPIFSIRQLRAAFTSMLEMMAESGSYQAGFLLASELNYEAAFSRPEDVERIKNKAKELSL